MVLAFAATLVVAGPGMVLAGGGGPSYGTPTGVVLVGPSAVATGSSSPYSLKVFFSDGSSSIFTSSASFSAIKGSFSGNTYQAPASPGKDGLRGTAVVSGATVIGTKLVTVQ
jgi:hypothetical protein